MDQLPSPDGSQIATIEKYSCDVGSFSTNITVEVHLVPAKQTAEPVDLLGVSTGGHEEGSPLIYWAAPHVLRVTIPMESFLKILTTDAHGVHVDVHFDPDDRERRAAWLRANGLPPDPPF